MIKGKHGKCLIKYFNPDTFPEMVRPIVCVKGGVQLAGDKQHLDLVNGLFKYKDWSGGE